MWLTIRAVGAGGRRLRPLVGTPPHPAVCQLSTSRERAIVRCSSAGRWRRPMSTQGDDGHAARDTRFKTQFWADDSTGRIPAIIALVIGGFGIALLALAWTAWLVEDVRPRPRRLVSNAPGGALSAAGTGTFRHRLTRRGFAVAAQGCGESTSPTSPCQKPGTELGTDLSAPQRTGRDVSDAKPPLLSASAPARAVQDDLSPTPPALVVAPSPHRSDHAEPPPEGAQTASQLRLFGDQPRRWTSPASSGPSRSSAVR